MKVSTSEKYINPFTDFGFKKLFGTEVNKDILMDFLNELIREKGRITEVRYLNAEQLGRTEYDRKAVFDIFCETERGEKFIVEMQKSKHNFFKDRSVFYASFPIRQQGVQGEWSYELKAVYMVGILDFVFSEDKDDKDYYHTEVKLMDTKKKTIFYDKLTFIYLEMPKFNKTIDQLETHFDKWLYVLKYLPKLQELPQRLRDRIFEKAFSIAEIAKMSVEEMVEYENSLKIYRDWHSTLTTARMEGEIKGRAEGKTEEKIKIALNLLKKNMTVEDICDVTGLSKEQIEMLVKENTIL
ncbi:MAG: Rpn family recombination-promoting nuclease/putative transposase [Chitinispirillales bacterium]|jgi:predicted transposase/invertase (TIGR01784 family)|nr:Rpn family recombination-promoting nuclease/putative transposase [Chitinispirillales bacterium]